MENRKSIEKINETKSRFFGKLSRISKPPAALIRKNESMQVMGIRNERGDVRKRNKHLPWDPTMPRLESDAKETKVQPTPVFLPGKYGQRSLVVAWGCKELDIMTKQQQ